MKSSLRYNPVTYLVLSTFFIFVGCGGGGGSSTNTTLSAVDSDAYPVAVAMQNIIRNAVQENLNVTVWVVGSQLDNLPGSLTINAPANSVFEGINGVSVQRIFESHLAGDPTIGGSISDTLYFDSNYNLLGYTRNQTALNPFRNSYYAVVTNHHSLPTSAKVGDSGALDSFTHYADSTKASVINTSVSEYAVEADTDTTAILHITQTIYTVASAVIETNEWRYRIDKQGAVSFVSYDFLPLDYWLHEYGASFSALH